MKFRPRLLVGAVLLAVALLFGAAGYRNQTSAATFSCKKQDCPNEASCNGSNVVTDGCSITCYVESGPPGHLQYSGGASCGTGPPQGD